MASERVAFIGTGDIDGDGFAMAYNHARAYRDIDECTLVACADLVRENAEAFADETGIERAQVYEDYAEMLTEVRPDVVSVCTPPATHADIVIDCARSGVVDAIHCEKPMAKTWKGSRLMTQECRRHDVQLTFNHQRRFGTPWQEANALIEGGVIGDLERIETSAPTLYDWGSHCFDLCGYFNDEVAVDWVLGQIHYRDENIVFGTHNENQSIVRFQYENGVEGLAATGGDTDYIGCLHRLVGTDGTIEVMVEEGPDLRVKRATDADWEVIDCPGEDYWIAAISDAIEDSVTALRTDRRPQLGARNALNATEIIFAAWESSRRRERVDLPLTIDDNPLEEMVESGAIAPN